MSSIVPQPTLWQRLRPWIVWKSLWEWIALVAGFAGIGCSVVGAGFTPEDGRTPWLIAGGFASALIIFSTWFVKKIDQWEKEDRDTRSATLARRASNALLEGVRDAGFGRTPNGEKHKNRATLFRHENGTLLLFARVGVYPDSTCRWAADQNCVQDCRGLAGEVWFRQALRERSTHSPYPTDRNQLKIAAYAKGLGMTVEEAERLNVKSQALLGIPVEVAGKPWGVLLLDSLNPDAFATGPPTSRTLVQGRKAVIQKAAKDIGRMLTEVL